MQKLAGEHRTAHPTTRVDAMFLQPAKVKDSVVGQPKAFAIGEEQAQLVPVAFIKFKAVDDDDGAQRLTANLDQS